MKKIFFYSLVLAATIVSCKKTEVSNPPVISSFTPEKLSAGNYVTIKGINFYYVAMYNTVKFNGLPATIDYVSGDTLLYVIVPKNVTSGKITVTETIRNITATSTNSYTVLPGNWAQKTDFPGEKRAWDVGFSIGNTGYIGLGYTGIDQLKDLYAYDAATDKWTQKKSLPIPMSLCASMVINDKAYVGIGVSADVPGNGYTNQFFEYDPTADKWNSKKEFPGTKRKISIGVGVGNKGYVLLGSGYDGDFLKDWWQYDPTADSWTSKTDLPFMLSGEHSFGFALNNKIYVGGIAYSSSTFSTIEFWQYDPATDTWTQKVQCPIRYAWGARSMVIGNKGYVMTDLENWQYDDVKNTWEQKAFFAERAQGVAFAIGNKGYYGTGNEFYVFNNHAELWEYTPE